ncbi:disintegrin and metalloproteinase domain-containing protein 12-like isoform X2 [Lytechinus variegatus]|uniref:disintegrin and metalloproteinase domain-containing protein 12-like isoform X2 n=1 Tax=Lytechinus variegatus TaxID=7654 RepID=UPI001BB27851|nr:disintegrin and metalloproteinase domain-containing protein 12-like isoform X2 [Lytechinus variegatus]
MCTQHMRVFLHSFPVHCHSSHTATGYSGLKMDGMKPPFKGYQVVIYLLVGILLNADNCSGYRLPGGQEEQLGTLLNYDIVTPYRLAGRERRQAHTITQDGHMRETSFVLSAFGKQFTLDVRLNEGLFPARYIEMSYAHDGEAVTRKPHPHHHCYYHGEVREANVSSVALSTCNGISGVFTADGDSYYIEPLLEADEEHLVYRPQDRRDKKTWVYDMDSSHEEQYKQEASEPTFGHRTRRDIHSETKFIELVIVNDYQEFVRYNGNITHVEARSKEIANVMDMIYRPMNVRVALVGVVTWSQTDQFIVESNPGITMGEFQRWRKDELLSLIKNDNAQFITGVSFDGSTVGMASLGTMCSDERSGGVSQDHDKNAAVVASTVAHEMGHNLGFIHDTTDGCQCDAPSNVGCVMEPSSGSVPPTNFSSCSYEYLETSLEKGLGACLFDYPDQIFDGPICGNGFLEVGEECDCGTVEECDNDCCIAATCRLHENATCAIGGCCEDCQLKKAGEVCRDLSNMCDLPEYCTGLSAECPANVYRQNGESCANMEYATCYDGQCLTFDDQCKKIWGDGARVAHEDCFDFNTQGSSFGNCGGTSPSFLPCERSNVKCGKLMCSGGESYPVLSSLAKASQGYIWDQYNNQQTCKSASIDLGQDVPDPGYVATGSLCAPGFVCSDFRCQNLSSLNIRACPQGCNGHGVCNSKNHCHCDPQWNPPLCNTPGYGGSIDSGPARATDQPGGPSSNMVIVLLVMFLCVLPGLALIGILVYCKRQTLSKMLSKGTTKQSYSSSNYRSQDKPAPGPSRPAPGPTRPAPGVTRPAPVKPTIHHTHLQDSSNVFKFPPSSASSTAITPARPAPVPARTHETPIVHRPAPTVAPAKKPTASIAPLKAEPAPKPAKPPVPLNKPPSPAKSAPQVSAPAPKAIRVPPKPPSVPSSAKPQFRLPPPIESNTDKPTAPPGLPTKPALKPTVPKVPLRPTPVTRPKPNVNRNNSTELDESSNFSPTSKVSEPPAREKSVPVPDKPLVALKPVPPKKPAVPNKPSVPSRPPALKPPVKRDPVV